MTTRRQVEDFTGVVLLDKKKGISSSKALTQIKHLYNAKKAGHTGNLDVLASGVLPICFGRATRYSQYLLDADKTYTVEATLGIKTVSADADSEIIATKSVPDFNLEEIENVLAKFRGKIKQVPPMHSALKYKGKPLYKYARKGIELERKAREVNIYKLELLDFQEKKVKLKVSCSKGTYIRSLVDDIGDMLGTGAYVTDLRRDKAANFSIEDALTYEEFLDLTPSQLRDKVLSAEVVLEHLPKVEISHEDFINMTHGLFSPIKKEQLACFNEDISQSDYWEARVHLLDGRFVGLAKVKETPQLRPICMLKAEYIPEFV